MCLPFSVWVFLIPVNGPYSTNFLRGFIDHFRFPGLMEQRIDSLTINPILISQLPSGSTQQDDPDESCTSRNQIGFPQTKIPVSRRVQ